MSCKPQSTPRRLSTECLEQRCLLATIPILHSFPEAEHTIYLDFDGETVASPHVDFDLIHAPPFDLDGTLYDANYAPSFAPAETEAMVRIWERIVEDYRPFHVDVTTEDPSIADPTIFSRDSRAVRVLFTTKFDEGPGGTGKQWYGEAFAGFATINSWRHESDVPAWVFSSNHRIAGEIASHEIGHVMGLTHDGDSSQTGFSGTYRSAHGSGETRWSPIMGTGLGLTQWSNGQYPNADNGQDDVGRLTFELGRRPDDYISITPLVTGKTPHVHREGFIGTEGDTDIFSFEVTEPDTPVDIRIDPWHNGPNLDIGVSLLGLSTGKLIGYQDSMVNPPDRLAAAFQITLDPDTYYLLVDGVGKPAIPGDPGYSDYGSLGYYKITGTIGPTRLDGDIDRDGLLSAQDIDVLIAMIRTGTGVPDAPFADLNQDRVIDRQDLDVLIRDILETEYADFNLDGQVNFTDFLQLSVNFGNSQSNWSDGDATGDGEIDFADFLLLSTLFGFGTEI